MKDKQNTSKPFIDSSWTWPESKSFLRRGLINMILVQDLKPVPVVMVPAQSKYWTNYLQTTSCKIIKTGWLPSDNKLLFHHKTGWLPADNKLQIYQNGLTTRRQQVANLSQKRADYPRATSCKPITNNGLTIRRQQVANLTQKRVDYPQTTSWKPITITGWLPADNKLQTYHKNRLFTRKQQFTKIITMGWIQVRIQPQI